MNDTAADATPEGEAPEADLRRSIRSFVKRGGRQTIAQARAMSELWPRYGVDFDGQPIDLDSLFGRNGHKTLEIGFGDGNSLVAVAQRHPERDYLGVEVHEPGVGHCLLAAEHFALTNVRLISHDAVDVLSRGLVADALDEVLIYFPDPWPKTRHHKRRLIQPAFVALLAQRMRCGGHLRLATDWAPYAEWMLEVLGDSSDFVNAASDRRFVPRPPDRPETKFERRGHRLGHSSYDLEFRRC
jgi:tRNA (guanine-N7-)-methyltransferase